MHDPLFEPIKINKSEFKNRIYIPAMHLSMTGDFTVTDRMIDFYAERARGGVGAICCGFATVDELAGNMTFIGAHDDKFVPGLTKLASAIKENGARAVLQLNHAGRYNMSAFLNGESPVAPSPVASRLTRETPRELAIEEIKTIVGSFAQAAQRAKKAGFDAVEILSGTGYLISSFLSPVTNKRSDEYGGGLENRMRFGLEVAGAVREAVGEDYALIIRLNGNDLMPGGIEEEDLFEYASRLAALGADALNINVGWHEARIPQIVSEVPRGAFAYLARRIRDRVDVPVIAGHRINDPETARDLLEEAYCDMVSMGRALIADPLLPEKAHTGREDDIVHCIGCAQGCFDNLFKMKGVECLCNPRAGYEADTRIKPADNKKKILVIGGGAAGMSAAAAACDRGHEVILCEKDEVLGGQLHLAGAVSGREEFRQLAHDLERQLSIRKLEVRRGLEVNEALLDYEKPDAVILATGAVPVVPDIPGVDLPHVVQAWDVLAGHQRTGRNVVVVGGGAVGVETALHIARKGTLSGEVLKFLIVQRAEKPENLYDLAIRSSKKVTLVEMMDKMGQDIGKTTRWVMIQDLKIAGIKTKTKTKVKEITEKGVVIENGDGIKELDADTVVLALGSKPVNALKQLLENKGLEYIVIGDALKPAKAFDAVHQGFRTGSRI